MMFNPIYTDGSTTGLKAGKVVCVGRNYADHIAELNNAVPDEPLLFMKGNNALVPLSDKVFIPEGCLCHNELELAFLIGSTLTAATVEQAIAAIEGVGLALDLTLREKQTELKAKGHPWERAKAFDGSCPVSAFVQVSEIDLQETLHFSLSVNEVLRQQGDSAQMLWSWPELVAHISAQFTLYPGDIVLTGTPKGVGPLVHGDSLNANLHGFIECKAQVQEGRAHQ